ncbi:MAG: 3-isopropylmalate dehydratase large subunit [archaeon]
MSRGTLYDKVLEEHIVDQFSPGRYQIAIGRQYMHEVTSPPAFYNLVRDGITKIPFPQLNTATIDHVIATLMDDKAKGFVKGLRMENALRNYCNQFGIELFDKGSGNQGIVHIIGPEMGLTQPGMTIVCGDSHTSTHGAFGNISYGIGTTQVEHVLRSQSLAHKRLKVRRINVDGKLPKGVEAKDVALAQIMLMGIDSGIGFANEWGGSALENSIMDERMTITNLGAECQAAASYFNPDRITVDYLRGRERVPKGEMFERAAAKWLSFASDNAAAYDEVRFIDAANLRPVVTWGNNPGQAVFIDERIPDIANWEESKRKSAESALKYMGFAPGEYMLGKKVNMLFIGSCTNGRPSDLEKALNILRGNKVHESFLYTDSEGNKRSRVLVVPGSESGKKYAESKGWDKEFKDLGAEWRDAGCSLCLGMNTDRINEQILIGSTSNRNFKNRMGKTARTVLMSPSMAAYAAITGKISDVREHTFKN